MDHHTAAHYRELPYLALHILEHGLKRQCLPSFLEVGEGGVSSGQEHLLQEVTVLRGGTEAGVGLGHLKGAVISSSIAIQRRATVFGTANSQTHFLQVRSNWS